MSNTERFRKGDTVKLIDVSGFAQPDLWLGRTFTVTRGGTVSAIYLKATDGRWPETFTTQPRRLERVIVAEPE